LKPCIDSGVCGEPNADPGVSFSVKAGSASVTSSAAPPARNATGRRMMFPDSQCQKPLVSDGVPPRNTDFIPVRPQTDRSAGCRVRAAAIEISGMRKPPTPIERMNGSGMNRSSASPIATVPPEKTTARPAVDIVLTIASS